MLDWLIRGSVLGNGSVLVERVMGAVPTVTKPLVHTCECVRVCVDEGGVGGGGNVCVHACNAHTL